MKFDISTILNTIIGTGVVIFVRELLIRYYEDKLKYGKASKRAVADDLLRYCSNAEAKDYTPPYEKEKEIYLLNSLAGLNRGYGTTFKELTTLLAYNEVADDLFDYKDKKEVLRQIKRLLIELKKLSYKLRK